MLRNVQRRWVVLSTSEYDSISPFVLLHFMRAVIGAILEIEFQ